MITGLDPSAESFLIDVARLQQRIADANRQISSGLRIASPADAIRSALSSSRSPSSAFTRAAAALIRPSQRATEVGIGSPETRKFSIALSVSSPQSSRRSAVSLTTSSLARCSPVSDTAEDARLSERSRSSLSSAVRAVCLWTRWHRFGAHVRCLTPPGRRRLADTHGAAARPAPRVRPSRLPPPRAARPTCRA